MFLLQGKKIILFFRGQGTRFSEKVGPIVKKVGESHFHESVAHHFRRGFLPEDLLEGVGLEHGIGITVAFAQEGIVFHIEQKNLRIRREMPVGEMVHRIDRQVAFYKFFSGFKTGGDAQRFDCGEVPVYMQKVEDEAAGNNAEQESEELFPSSVARKDRPCNEGQKGKEGNQITDLLG